MFVKENERSGIENPARITISSNPTAITMGNLSYHRIQTYFA